VPSMISATKVPAGMPEPDTAMPTRKLLVPP